MFVDEQKLSIHAFKPITSKSGDGESQFINNAAVKIHHLSPNFIFEEPILRGLLNESSTIFTNLQKVELTNNKPNYVMTSLSYRSALRACLEKLQEQSNQVESTELERVQDLITIFYTVECIWHLCELMFINKSTENLIVKHLLDWARFHFSHYERSALKMMNLGHEVDTDEDYWPTVKDLIVKGQLDVARTLLVMHPQSETTPFQAIEQILSSMPVYSSYGGLSIQKFRSQWKYWCVRVESNIQSGVLVTEPELDEIARLVTGDKAAWSRLCKSTDCWYEYFPGFLFYTEPSCMDFELRQYVNAWMAQWLSSNSQQTNVAHLNQRDRIIFNVLENNIHQVLHDIQELCDNKWFVTHLSDLLHHCGSLSSITDQDMSDFRDCLVYNFGVCLMSQPSFWKVGCLNYLEYCNDGPAARELLLSRLPFRNEDQANKYISAARQIGATGVESEICRVIARRNLQNGRHGNALQWAIRSTDKIFITALVNYFLEHYTRTGEMLCEDVLSSVGAKMFLCPRLVFLVKYYDFQQYYKESAFSQAGELLINLLDSKITPPFFWPCLLSDTIPLLETKEPIIPTKETLTILHHLTHDLLPLIEKEKKLVKEGKSKSDNTIIENTINGKPEDLVQLLRLACARNLGRSLIIENTIGP